MFESVDKLPGSYEYYNNNRQARDRMKILSSSDGIDS